MPISTLEELKKTINLTEDELKWFEQKKESDLSFLIPDSFKTKLNIDAIRIQFVPNIHELDESVLTYDPQCEKDYTVCSYLVHRYKNRVAFTITDKCFGYCRHCFRRRFTSNSSPCTYKDVEKVAEYLKKHDEVEEILITGGDPLTLSNEFLRSVFQILRSASPNLIFRLCTRALCVNPNRFDDELLSIMKNANEKAPMFLLTQFNSHHEFSDDVRVIAKKISNLGISMFNQSVLLKGVNDDKESIIKLCRELLLNRIKPYYIFQGDDVKGTEHLVTTLQKAFELECEVREELSGLEMPTFCKDRSKGAGKIPIGYIMLRDKHG